MQYAQSEAEKLAIAIEFMGFDWKRDYYGWSDTQIYDSEIFPFIDGTGTFGTWWEDAPIDFDLRYPLDSHKDAFLRGYSKSELFRVILMVLFGLGDYSKNQVQSSNAGGVSSTTNSGGYGNLSRAQEYGIKPYNEMHNTLRNTDLQAHHIVEQRFGYTSTSCVAVTRTEHQVFTNHWRQLIPYGTDYNALTRNDVWDAAQKVYAAFPALLEAARQALGF